LDIWHEDAITVNPYLGTDGIEPFTRACRETGKSMFVLVKTSNKSSAELQDIRVWPEKGGVACDVRPDEAKRAAHGFSANGNCGQAFDSGGASGGQPDVKLYERIADYVEAWGDGLIGVREYSAVGAVVGATHPEVGRALRNAHPSMFFLVPGYGAQGARACDLSGFFDGDGRGCIVNSSRGIIAAWQRSVESAKMCAAARSADQALATVASAARASALDMAKDLRAATT
jgi:orotidine-5'-phosphate decarboxylase